MFFLRIGVALSFVHSHVAALHYKILVPVVKCLNEEIVFQFLEISKLWPQLVQPIATKIRLGWKSIVQPI
ncbi:unnamed protein product [Larinioides sclopetarius]|uniref:Secreted protein n=1 Tax=Larinioides sclopetarius TaxID=280406 RepID=A0AAV2AEZ4_9ARAC